MKDTETTQQNLEGSPFGYRADEKYSSDLIQYDNGMEHYPSERRLAGMRRSLSPVFRTVSALRPALPRVLCLLAYVLLSVIEYGCSGGGHFTSVQAEGNAVRIPIQDVNDGQVHFYEIKLGGKRIHFFVRSDGAGNLHTHFDACRTCYRHKKGYRQDGTEIICNECGYKFRLAEEEWKDINGCTPIGIPHTEDSNSLVIQVTDLRKGTRFFD